MGFERDNEPMEAFPFYMSLGRQCVSPAIRPMTQSLYCNALLFYNASSVVRSRTVRCVLTELFAFCCGDYDGNLT